jgi:phthalate 4,5-cis-dihydrodiol dehydrogenase
VAVLVEKPIAPSLEAGRRMVNEAERRGGLLMVCHKRSVDRPILAMWRMINSGELGRVCFVHRWHFSDWHYRPRLAGELSPPAGGAVLRQGSHEFDIIRLLAGGSARELLGFTGDRDPGRPGEGSYLATVAFDRGVVATSIYSGYDFFRSDELTFGLLDASAVGAARRNLDVASDRGSTEAEQKRERSAGARGEGVYGFTLVGCEGGDLRAAPGGGIFVYESAGRRRMEVAGPAGGRFIAEELRQAVTEGHRPLHDGWWGLANLELCLAVRESARQGGPVALTEQRALSAEPLERITGALVREPAEPSRP